MYVFLNDEQVIKYYILLGTGGKGMSAVTDRAYLPAGIPFSFHCSVSGM
jgi:azurin